MFFVVLGTNSDYFYVQHSLIGFYEYNRDDVFTARYGLSAEV